MSGWLKLHRQLQDNPLWLSEPFSRGQAWVDLMMLANYKDSFVRVRGQRIDVPVGHVARSQIKLAERWKWSRGKVIRFLKELQDDGQIEQITSHDFNVIRLCNFTQYQDDSARDESPDESRDRSRDGQPTGHETVHETVHIIRKKEGKEEKEEKETPRSPDGAGGCGDDEFVITLPAKGGSAYGVTTAAFERYRENYPHLDVMAQLRSMRQHLQDNPQKRTPEWSCKQFISNWLNNRISSSASTAKAINTHGEFTPERYAIDETARKFKISGGKS